MTLFTGMPRALILLIVASVISASPAFGRSDLIAIDVPILPGPKMVAEAERWNAMMREQKPDGFKLDEEHAPHITLVQRFIARADLPDVLAAVDEVKSKFALSSLRMTAIGLYDIPNGKNAVAGIVIEPTEQLHALQQAVIEAVNPYARKGGDESAFVPDQSGTPFDPALFKYVETFVPNQSGEKFTFGAKGIATYQLGNFGMASKRLDRDHQGPRSDRHSQ